MILDTPTCAAMLRCSESHLKKLARQGIVPATKVGRGWIFIEEDVLAWLRSPKVERVVGRPRKRKPL